MPGSTTSVSNVKRPGLLSLNLSFFRLSMKMINSPFRSQQSARIPRLVGFLLVAVLFIASNTPIWVLAQSADDPWAEPLNLSRSGVATNPALVIDSQEVIHVVWQDTLADFVYTRFDGEQWSVPETTNLNILFGLPPPGESIDPELTVYTGPNPLFIAGPGQFIFAFWISPEGRLFTSSVENGNFGEVAAWNSGRVISPEASAFSVAADASGELHAAFFRTVGDSANPAGIYYTRSKNSGRTWAVPVLLYESSYLGSLDEGEANISVATTGTDDSLRVYIAWDIRPRKQVFLAQSADGGESWGQPALIAGPAPGSGLTGPYNIQVGAKQDSIALVWQNSRSDGACTHYSQSSIDAGQTWSAPQPMLEGLLGCALSNKFVTGLANSPGNPFYLLTETQSQTFLTAWNGRQWSQSQPQQILSGFEEPEIFSDVIYGCHQASMSGNQLYIVGCDQGVGGDIWITSRDLRPNMFSFSSSAWSQPSPITDDSLMIEAVELVATGDDLIHAFFSQRQDPAIYYTYWNGELWSRVTPVLELQDGEAGWPAIAIGPGNELFLLTHTDSGALYFNRATSGNAATQSRWSTPSRLEITHDGQIGSADLASDSAETIYAVYSVPVNEERGIYLTQSKDQGTSWTEPVQVFDGMSAGFDLVGAPSLLVSENGVLHILWKEQSIGGDGIPQSVSLYYNRSEDGGRTFSEAKLIVDEPVAWQEIVADGTGSVHLLWQQQDTMTTVWDQVSSDGGRTWEFPQALPDEGTSAAVTVDIAGRLHVVDAGPGSLGHWLWDGGRWQPDAPLHWSLAPQQDNPVDFLAAAINKQGNLVVVLSVPTGANGTAEGQLLYSTRTIKLPSTQTEIQEVPTLTLLPPTLSPATPTAEGSPTLLSTDDNQSTSSQDEVDVNGNTGQISPYTIALLPVALLLLSVLGIMIRRASRAEDR